jgi:putative transposase
MALLRTADPLTRSCRVLALPRRPRYDQAQPREDREVRQAIAAVAPPFPTDGSRRVAAQVRRAPYRRLVNRQRAQRLMRHRGWWRRTRPHTPHTTHRRHGFRRCPNLAADRVAREPDEIWVGDLTSVRRGAECIDLAMMRDVWTRDLRGWQLGRTLGQELTLSALQRALVHHTPVLHHRDQGMQ